MEEETEKKSPDLATNEDNANSDKQEDPENPKADSPADVFKKPLIHIGGRNKKGLQTRTLDPNFKKKEDSTNENIENSNSASCDTSSEQETSSVEEVKDLVPAPPSDAKVSRKEPPSSAKSDISKQDVYKEPNWGGVPEDAYSFEVLKEGVNLEPINLCGASYFIFGRHTSCDNQLIHPTISRFHLVMQYCSEGSKNLSKGFYIYDLGSTHGTFLNKNRIKPQMYVRMQVGHQLRLGCSSRIFILTGPEDDMEAESELTVTELKAERERKLLEREMAEKEKARLEEEKKKRLEEEGIDWGMGEDADQDEDLTENPYAITNNEELYISDPKKSLRGWFEREGYDLEYDVQEKGPGQFLCRVEIPTDDGKTVAEALVKGKKKEAVVQCALEACRILDRQGLLRQANHESRKKKAKNWEADDYYDSDDDTFLDRTGLVEKKRQQRMAAAGRSQEKAETYESLMKKHEEVLKQISEVEQKLKHASDGLSRLHSGAQDDEEDALDSFMKTLNKSGAADKTAVSKLKTELTNLNKEESQLRRLVNIAKPANLPPLLSPSNFAKPVAQSGSKVAPIIGSMKRSNAQKRKVAPSVVSEKKVRGNNDDNLEEVEEDEDEELVSERLEKESSDQKEKPVSRIPSAEVRLGTPSDRKNKSKLHGPAKPQFLSSATKEEESTTLADEEKMDDEEEGDAPKESKKRKRSRIRPYKKDKMVSENCESDPSDPKYSTWVPPAGQTGDGRTALNDKLGY